MSRCNDESPDEVFDCRLPKGHQGDHEAGNTYWPNREDRQRIRDEEKTTESIRWLRAHGYTVSR